MFTHSIYGLLGVLTALASGSAKLRKLQVSTATPPTFGPGDHERCDLFCQVQNGSPSYCKYWLSPPVCQIGDQPCSPDVCDVPPGATVPPLSTPSPEVSDKCDR
ncbi:hypothetical protein FOZ63_008783, partial [Perkinsus olseni]